MYREVLSPFRIERLLLGLRLVDALAIEVEDDEGIGLAATINAVDTVTVDEIDSYNALVYTCYEQSGRAKRRSSLLLTLSLGSSLIGTGKYFASIVTTDRFSSSSGCTSVNSVGPSCAIISTVTHASNRIS